MVLPAAFVTHGFRIPPSSLQSQLPLCSPPAVAVTLRRNVFLPGSSAVTMLPRRFARPVRGSALRATLSAGAMRTETSAEFAAVAAVEPHRATRLWKPLQVFSISPLQKERANRVFSRRVSGKASAPGEATQELSKEKEQPVSDAEDQFAQIDLITTRPALEGRDSTSAATREAGVQPPTLGNDATALPVVDDATVPTADVTNRLHDSPALDVSTGTALVGKSKGDTAPKKTRKRAPAARRQVERKSWKRFASHDELVEETLQLTGDPLERDGGRVVIFRGSPSAELMIIGEGPGAEEDRLGLPFVGKSGQLLNRIFRFAGFDVDADIYVTNAVKRRPRDNRAPTALETDYYRGLLLEQIRLVDPKLVVLAGRSAMEAMLPDAAAISKMRGKWYSIGARVAMPVFHPSYLLRNPAAKAVMKEDVLEIRRKYLECVPGARLGEVRNQGSA